LSNSKVKIKIVLQKRPNTAYTGQFPGLPVMPRVAGKNFYEYSLETLQQIQLFSKLFLGILKAG